MARRWLLRNEFQRKIPEPDRTPGGVQPGWCRRLLQRAVVVAGGVVAVLWPVEEHRNCGFMCTG
jgi:hypothetical protein